MSIDKVSEEISFGEWLRQRRRMSDLTQQALADQVGCARITLRQIESGGRKPSKELAQILLSKLGIPEIEHPQWIRFARGLSAFPATLSATFPSKPLTNLPAALTTFIGREKELDEITKLIARNRLVTLAGAGGIGKTSLSLQVGQKLLGEYSNGVWLVELAPILDPLLVPRVTATAMGLRDEPGRPVIEILAAYLREKKMLIILDNCEHLLDACARMAEKILQAAPNAQMLASSREPLGIRGEVTYRVPSLRLPDMEHLPPIASFSQYEAVGLFIDRATAVVPAFKVTKQNSSALVQICHRLDGIPLAIELAAAKVRFISMEEIDKRLGNRFRLLIGGSRTALPQHQTLQATIDWSYDLLSPTEQTLFQHLSVFVNGWTLEAAESIAADTNIKSENILDLLSQLINKSLVNKEETISKTRYRMLETIREYAFKKLTDSDELITICFRHLLFFAELVDEAERNFKGPDQALWYGRLDHELDNLRAAMTWFEGTENAEVRLRFSARLWRYWKNRGQTREGRGHLQRVLEDLPPGPARQTSAYARALTAAGSLAYYEGDFPYSDQSRKDALEIFRNLDDKVGIADCLNGLGNTAMSQGHYDSARGSYEESLLIRKDLGDQWGIARLLGNLGLLAYFQMDYVQARALHLESLTLFRELRDEEGIANELVNLGDVVRRQGELSIAHSFYKESAAISGKLKDKWGLGYALMGMADVALAQGDLSTSALLYRNCLIMFQKGADYVGLPFALESVAALELVKNQPEKAVRILGAADTLRKNTNSPLPLSNLSAYQMTLSLSQQQLDSSVFDLLWVEGRGMTIYEAIALALEELA
jgi:predicted ATPase/DNA-binding XRE family transcriptional regulator